MPFADASVLIIAGPTGSGKSALAGDAAQAFDGVVINADSMQVYRELRVLTARPTPEDEARVPHRLFGVLSAAERCSAGRWLGLARGEIKDAWSAGRLPIVVGGTGLYLKALHEGFADIPPIPTEVRAEAEALYAELGGERFRHELARAGSGRSIPDCPSRPAAPAARLRGRARDRPAAFRMATMLDRLRPPRASRPSP